MSRKLVVKLNDVWSIYDVDGDLVPLPVKTIYCPMIYDGEVCGGLLILHDFHAYYHPGINHYHLDIHLKCSKCGKHYTFGLAIPPKIFEKLRKSKYHGKTLRWELQEIYSEIPSQVIERLRNWGYW